jgi:hypothetical protein
VYPLKKIATLAKNSMKYFFIYLIRFYQVFLSPIFGKGKCRFYPTCSLYAIHAIEYYGVIKGLYLAAKRIGRCHPFHNQSGFDPIPRNESKDKR